MNTLERKIKGIDKEIENYEASKAITETGVAGTGAIGTETPEAAINETGVAGDGAIGTEALELNAVETGVAGTGAVE